MNNILDHFEQTDEQTENWRLFAGPRADYYIGQWRKIKSGQWLTFNIFAFLLGVFWLLYRQMLRPTILYLALYVAEVFIEKMVVHGFGLGAPPLWWIGVRILLFSLLLGFLGNWIYLIHAEEQIDRIQERYPPEQQGEMLRLRGGVSIIPVILFLCLILIILLTNAVLRGW